ncbi:lantibiotic dehydratase [Streptomyces fradiae]|uniref:lantibiotic dehydratase n=1 Tax=Streptomyces fradiae TaxID=1906 RepID=UPI0035BE8CF6
MTPTTKPTTPMAPMAPTTQTDPAAEPDAAPAAGPGAAGPPHAAEWEPGRRFVLRAAGLPVEAVRGLRCPGARRWADAVLAEEERLTAAGAALSDRLHTLVKATIAADPPPAEGTGDSAEASGEDRGATARRALLALRRQVFNNRLPADPEAAVRLVSGLDAEAGGHTARWLRDRAALEELRAGGADLLARELGGSRRALREVLADDRLRLGLLLASPALDGRLDTYLRDTSPRPGNRLRKIERAALTYVYRTACKTSPFSTLTGIGLGTFDGTPADSATPDATTPDSATPDGTTNARTADARRGAAALGIGDVWVSRVRLNVVVLARLTELILADPALRRDLPVVLSPGWARDADRVRYVRHLTTAGDDSAAVTFDAVRDRLFFLRGSGTLDRLLEWLGGREVPVRHRDLVDWLRAEHGAVPEDCERYASALLDLGLVQVPSLRTDVHSRDPLRSYQEALRSVGAPWADRLAGLLDGPAGLLDRYPGAGVAERRALLADLRARLLDAQRELGAAEPALPQTLVYEDVSAGEGLVCGSGVLGGETGRALRAVEGVLPLFDLTLPQRITLLGFFVARYGRGGRCDDLLGLVHDFHEDFFDQYVSFTSKRAPFDADGAYVPEENWLGQDEMKALDRARRLFHEGMRALWRRHGEAPPGGSDADGPNGPDGPDAPVSPQGPDSADGTPAANGPDGRAGTRTCGADASGPAEEIELPAGLLAGAARELAPLMGRFTPQSHHLQLSRPPDGPPLVVLNKSYGGLAFPFSRFTHLYDDPEPAAPGTPAAPNSPTTPGRPAPRGLSDALREEIAARAPEGAVFAEVTGGPVTSNLNLHGRLTGHQIVCPGETSGVPEEARIHLDDLYVEHDERENRLVLRSRRLGREVVPVYLGYLVPIALPAISRTLLLLSPSTMAPFDVWAGVPEGGAADGVARRPRVRHGNVVVSRRSWTAGAESLPSRRPGAGDAEYFLDWQRWRRAHGLPDRCFATAAGPRRSPVGAKPVYVDFDSPLCLSAFDALVEREPGTRVTFREMLPAEDGLHLTSPRGRHVAELAVETFTTRPAAPAEPEDTPSCPN